MNDIKLSSIVAMSENRVIGKGGALPWHISEDLKHFKRTTMGKPVIMGRKSYESLGKPLPGRANLVVSRSHTNLENSPTSHYSTMESVNIEMKPEGVNEGPFLFLDIDRAIQAAKKIALESDLNEVFITGGGEIYKQTLDSIDCLYLTLIHQNIEGDTYFPEINFADWQEIDKQEYQANDNAPGFTILTLHRPL